MATKGKLLANRQSDTHSKTAMEIITGKKSEFSFTNEHMLRGHEQEPIAEGYMKKQTLLTSLTADFLIAVIMVIVQTD